MLSSTLVSRRRCSETLLGLIIGITCCLTSGAGAEPYKILPVGDSITVGYTDNPKWTVPFKFGYRGALYDKLVADGFDVRYVGGSPEPHDAKFGKPTVVGPPNLASIDQDRHEGYGGARTRDIKARIAAALAKRDPDVILLMIGINDIKRGSSKEPIAAMINLNAIVRAIADAKPEAKLIIAQTIPPTTPTPAIKVYNDFIKNALVPAYSAQGHFVTTVDQHANFVLPDGSTDASLYSNGINHPSEEGYAKMAQTWYDGIRAIDLNARSATAREAARKSNLVSDRFQTASLQTAGSGKTSTQTHELRGLTPGQKYCLSFQAKAASPGKVSLRVVVADTDAKTTTTLFDGQPIKPATDDLPYADTFTATSPTMTLIFTAEGPQKSANEIQLHSIAVQADHLSNVSKPF